MNSREKILGRLRGARRPFSEIAKPDLYTPMVTVEDKSQEALYSLFVEKAQAASCVVYRARDHSEAIQIVIRLLGEDKIISSWELEHIPLPGLAEALDAAGISLVGQDEDVRIGMTGADSALAATGSVVLLSGAGRFRAASLLPTKHIVVMTSDQILPDLESWWEQQRATGLKHVRQYSNVVITTGPSRTADIAMELVMGMHGPRELDIVILD